MSNKHIFFYSKYVIYQLSKIKTESYWLKLKTRYAQKATKSLSPTKSKHEYEKKYETFTLWQ